MANTISIFRFAIARSYRRLTERVQNCKVCFASQTSRLRLLKVPTERFQRHDCKCIMSDTKGLRVNCKISYRNIPAEETNRTETSPRFSPNLILSTDGTILTLKFATH